MNKQSTNVIPAHSQPKINLKLVKPQYTADNSVPDIKSPEIILSENAKFEDLSPSLQASYIRQKMAAGIGQVYRRNFG